MKKLRDPRLGKRPRIKRALLKETMEGQKTYDDYKKVLYHKSEKTMNHVKDEGRDKDGIQLK